METRLVGHVGVAGGPVAAALHPLRPLRERGASVRADLPSPIGRERFTGIERPLQGRYRGRRDLWCAPAMTAGWMAFGLGLAVAI